jgi:hypothetical protein
MLVTPAAVKQRENSMTFYHRAAKYINLAIVIIIMRKLIFSLIFLFAFSGAFAQRTLVLEKIGTPKKYVFHTGDYLKVRTKKTDAVVKSYLWAMTDSSLTIGPHTVIQLPDVSAVYKHYYFQKFMTRALLYAGAGYFVLDSFNNLINHQQVFIPQTLIISSSIVGVGLAIMPLGQKKIRIGIRWKLKIMDINLN